VSDVPDHSRGDSGALRAVMPGGRPELAFGERIGMFASAGPMAGADAAVDMALGVVVVLAFVIVVVRALTSRKPCGGLWNRRAAQEQRGPQRPGGLTAPPARDAARAATPDRDVGVAAPDHKQTRLRLETLAPLARLLDTGRRLAAAEGRVAAELRALPGDVWLVERGVFVAGRRIPFLVAGATGVFLVCPTDGAWTLQDLHVMSELGDQVDERLPGHDARPHAAVCLAFDAMEPRAWFGGHEHRGRGGWVLGVNWLLRWITGFDSHDGLGAGDVRRLDAASGPFWERRSTARLPATPKLG
jgi:hypothetical protein